MSKNLKAIILAAGKGERLKSKLPKVLQEISGKPLISYVLDMVRSLKIKDILVVVGYGGNLVRNYLDKDIKVVEQKRLLGTADALKCALARLKNLKGDILVLNSDHPLLKKDTLSKLVKQHLSSNAACSLLVAHLDNPKGYGRIIRDNYGRVIRITEEVDITTSQLSINEINVGVYCFKLKELAVNLKKIKPDNQKKEYYLTDIVSIFVNQGLRVDSLSVEDATEAIGVNTVADLSNANKVMRMRILEYFMSQGVNIVSPETTFIYSGVRIGFDTIIHPFTVIENDAIIGKNCSIGPFCHIRPNTILEDRVNLGNFTEVSRSRLGKDTFAKHFCFLGDARVGSSVNIGAGVVTANFDGKNKNITKISDKAFIGSDTVLIAPVSVGRQAITGAGAIVTKGKQVRPFSVVVGIPAKELGKEKKDDR